MKTCFFSKRIRKDRLSPETADQLTVLLADFNRLQRAAYQSQIRERRLAAQGIPVTHPDSLHVRKKTKFGLNDYYTNSAIQNANALISSQTELKKLYQDQTREKIRKLKKKLKQVRAKRTQTQKIKNSLKAGKLNFPKRSHWQIDGKRVIRKYRGKVKTGSHSRIYFNVYDFEIQHINKRLKRLKQQVGALQFRLHRLEEQLKTREATIPGAVFGGKKRFQSRRQCRTVTQKKRWKEEFTSARNKRMRISGRRDAKHGNFVFLYNEQTHVLHLTLPNRDVIAFDEIVFPYGQEIVDRAIETQRTCPNKKMNGKAIAWELEDHSRYYLIKVIIDVEPNPHTNYSRTAGVIGVDCNVDHFAWCDVSADGNYLASGTVRFPIHGKRSGQVTKLIEAAAIEVVRLAKDANKPIALEQLDTTLSRTGDRYGSRKANRLKSLFASRKMAGSIKARADKEGVAVFDVHPAYTSISGKFKHMRRLGISVHESAGLTIGRRALGYKERVPRCLHAFVTEHKKTNHHWSQWHDLDRKFDLSPEKIRSLYNLHQPADGFSLDHLTETEQLKIGKRI